MKDTDKITLSLSQIKRLVKEANLDEAKLKTCPFCGGAAHLREFRNGKYTVQCDNTSKCGAGFSVPVNTEEEAIAQWNNRRG